jgi:Family of unknown function (DUF5985)
MLLDFLAGAVTFGFAIAALFFLRFWSRTRDPLFGAFAAAFSLLGLCQALLALAGAATEEQGWVYLLRLAAFAIILVAIAGKNRPRR